MLPHSHLPVASPNGLGSTRKLLHFEKETIMDLKAIKTLTAVALLAATTAAHAGTSPFSLVGGATAPGVDVSLTIQESVVPGYDYDFVVTNSSLMGIVTGVYFEVDWNRMLTGAGDSNGPATLLPASLNPQISDWKGSKASHTVEQKRVRKWQNRRYVDYYYENLDHGIQVADVQTFSFTTDTSIVSLADLERILASDGYGVAIRMQGLTSDAQASGWGEVEEMEEQQQLLVVQAASFITQDPGDNDPPKVTGAPTPTAALAGIAMLGFAGFRRRRHK